MPKFGHYGTLESEKESYKDGYNTGKSWTYKAMPSGPYVFEQHTSNDPVWIKFCEQSKRNHDEWWRGFNKASED